MKHRLSSLRSENNKSQFSMNHLKGKACRSLRHRLSLKQQQQQQHSNLSSPLRHSHSLPSGGGTATNTTVIYSPPILSLSGPQGYVQARKEANETINAKSSYNNNNKTDESSSSSAATLLFMRTVDNRPYFPLLKLEDPSNEESILEIARVVVTHRNGNAAKSVEHTTNGGSHHCSNGTNTTNHHGKGTVVPITGGLTNALYKVDLPTITTSPSTAAQQQHSYLVRIFGAEGMIDRDEETANFARLCGSSSSSSSSTIVHNQLDIVGRFANGRVETWIPNMRPASHITDFGKVGLVLEMARQFARLHYGYTLPPSTASLTTTATANSHGDSQHAHAATTTIIPRPTLWNVIHSWIDDFSQKLSHETFRNNDPKVSEAFVRAIQPLATGTITPDNHSLASYLSEEVIWLKKRVEIDFPNAAVVFCHNDVNAANVLLHTSIDNDDNDVDDSAYNKQSVCIIDYEYGSMNYATYDIANFMCEHCGGNDTGCPNYELLPSAERQTMFLREYIREREKILQKRNNKNDSIDKYVATATSAVEEAEVADLLAQVKLFQMASNLLWGVWGVLQSSGEVMEGTFRMEIGPKSWDNLRYGKNRLERYRYCKDALLRSWSV